MLAVHSLKLYWFFAVEVALSSAAFLEAVDVFEDRVGRFDLGGSGV